MISVVIPAFNEEGIVGQTVGRTSQVLERAGVEAFEIIVVDDGSTDRTAKFAEQAGARVISHPHNAGYGRSLKDGIAAARYETIVINDADGTYPIEEIPRLVNELGRGFDMVVGRRTGIHYRESFLKSPLRLLLRAIVQFTAGCPVPDINSGLRTFHRDTAKSFFPQLCDTFSFTTSLTLAYLMNGKFVTYREIEYFDRTGVTKVRLFRDSLRTLQYILEAATFYNPLKIFLLCAALCLGLAAVSILAALSLQLVSLFMLGVGSILVAILILGLGLVAVLLKQIMHKR